MSEITPEPTASPENQIPTGSSTEVPRTPSSSEDSFSQSSGDADARARAWQGKYDQMAAQNRRLEERLSSLESAPPPRSLTREEVEAAAAQSVFRVQSLLETKAALREEFPDVLAVNPRLFEDLHTYSSPEQFRVRVEEENTRLSSAFKSRDERMEQEILQRYVDRYGPIAPVSQETPQPGELTLDQLAAMSMDEIDEYEAQHGAGSYEVRFHALQKGLTED